MKRCRYDRISISGVIFSSYSLYVYSKRYTEKCWTFCLKQFLPQGCAFVILKQVSGALHYSSFSCNPLKAPNRPWGPRWRTTAPTLTLWKKDIRTASFGFTSPSQKKRNTIPRHIRGVVWHQSGGIVKSSAQKQRHSGGFEAPVLQNWAETWWCLLLPCISAMRLHQ